MAAKSNGEGRNGFPRIVDIAERCGVSAATVCGVLKGTGRQSQDTIERVIRTANEMGYNPARSHAARQLIMSRFGQTVLNHTLGLFFIHHIDNYSAKALEGAIDAVGIGDPDEIQFGFVTYDHRLNRLPLLYQRGNIDGVLSIAQQRGWEVTYDLLRMEPCFGDRPIVGVIEHLDGCSGVYPDHYQVGRDAINHLFDLGHRHIMHFVMEHEAKPDVHGSRLSAYIDACVERGLDPELHLHHHPWMFGNEATTCSSKEALIVDLQKHPEITAILARHDKHAIDIYDGLTKGGYRVPEDISLIGSDDTDPVLDSGNENILTTVHLPLREAAYEGTKLLIRRVLGEEKEDREIVLPVKLIVRKTTAPPPRKLA